MDEAVKRLHEINLGIRFESLQVMGLKLHGRF